MGNWLMTWLKSEQTRDEVETGLKDPKTDVNNTVQRVYFDRDGDSDSDSDVDVEFGEENFDLTESGLKDPKPDDNNTVQRAAGQTKGDDLPRSSTWNGTRFNITNNCSTANIRVIHLRDGRGPVPVDVNVGNASVCRRDVYDFVGSGRPASPLFRMTTETTNVIQGATGPHPGVPSPPPPPQPGIA